MIVWVLSIGCASSPRARAVRAIDEHAWAQAEAILVDAVREDPVDDELWTLLGRVRMHEGDAVGAREAFEHVARLRPKSGRARLWIGQSHELQRDYDAALAAYRHAVQLEPDNAYVHRFAGARVLRWGNAPQAVEWLSRATELDAGHAETWNALGIAQAGAGDRGAAITTFQHAVALHPEHQGLRLGLAATLINEGRLADARDAYRDIVQRWPDFAAALVGQSLVLEAMGELASAEKLLRRAVALEPADPSMAEYLQNFRRRNPRTAVDNALQHSPR